MSKSKKRSIDEIQDLKREIKDRDAIIKALRREIKSLNQELNPEPKKSEKKKPEIVASGNCPSCKKGKLNITELGVRTLRSCPDCGHRTVTKHGEA